ncbi:MAG: hypothetical protein P8R04_02800, partial [Gammaproteobacteria bacterium]|nr:hypothetical protein [Gammaproteobacteria bacterium]
MDYQEITYEINAINGYPESSTRSGIQVIEAYVPMYNVNPFFPAGCEASTARFRYDPNTGFVTMYSRSPIYVKDVPTYEGPLRLEMR